MDNIEEVISTKIKNGWRAIIYDAPWAHFKPNQEGVIITSDGRACETTDDSKDSIIIVADANLLFTERDNGHVLFRQKGSDLFDIVCLYQEDGGEYSIEIGDSNGNIGNVTVDGCSGTFTDFKNTLKVYETINGVTKELKKGEYVIEEPNAQYFADNIPNDSDSPKTTLIVVSSVKYSSMPPAIGSLTITTKDETKEDIDKDASTIDLSNIYVQRESDTSYFYSIKRSPNKSTPCEGGSVTFSLERTLIEDPQYVIMLSSVEISTIYAVIYTQCGIVIGTGTKEPITDISDITFTVEGNVSNISYTEDGNISLTISDSVNSFRIIAENSIGVRSEITLYRNTADGSFKSQVNA